MFAPICFPRGTVIKQRTGLPRCCFPGYQNQCYTRIKEINWMFALAKSGFRWLANVHPGFRGIEVRAFAMESLPHR